MICWNLLSAGLVDQCVYNLEEAFAVRLHFTRNAFINPTLLLSIVELDYNNSLRERNSIIL